MSHMKTCRKFPRVEILRGPNRGLIRGPNRGLTRGPEATIAMNKLTHKFRSALAFQGLQSA